VFFGYFPDRGKDTNVYLFSVFAWNFKEAKIVLCICKGNSKSFKIIYFLTRITLSDKNLWLPKVV